METVIAFWLLVWQPTTTLPAEAPTREMMLKHYSSEVECEAAADAAIAAITGWTATCQRIDPNQ